MRFAVTVQNFGAFADIHRLVELAIEAEDSGWDGFFLWDHIFWGGPPMLDPWVTLAATATPMRRLTLPSAPPSRPMPPRPAMSPTHSPQPAPPG